MFRALAGNLGALTTKQLGFVPQVVECGTLTCYMLGLSCHNTENLTANHIGATCLERCHVHRTLKNPAVVFDRSSNHFAPSHEA